MADREKVLGFRLRGHHLRRRVRDLAGVVGACGVRTTPAGSAPAALAARLTTLPPGAVDDALDAGTLVTVLGPRLVPTLVLPADVAVFTTGALPLTEASLRVSLGDRVADALGGDLRAAVERTRDVARERLAGGPLTRGALSAALTKALPPSYAAPCRTCASTHVHETLFRAAGGAGGFAPAPAEGRTALVTALDVPADDGARLELVRRFLRCHGPAGPADFAAWANTGPADARERWADLDGELEPVDGGELLAADLPSLRRAGLPAGVRLLPPNDPYLLTRDRATLVPYAGMRGQLWPAAGAPGAVLVDGEIAGPWRAQKRGDVLRVQVPAGLPDLAAEADRLAPHRGCATAAVTVS